MYYYAVNNFNHFEAFTHLNWYGSGVLCFCLYNHPSPFKEHNDLPTSRRRSRYFFILKEILTGCAGSSYWANPLVRLFRLR
jgi:hypothetical protein